MQARQLVLGDNSGIGHQSVAPQLSKLQQLLLPVCRLHQLLAAANVDLVMVVW